MSNTEMQGFEDLESLESVSEYVAELSEIEAIEAEIAAESNYQFNPNV